MPIYKVGNTKKDGLQKYHVRINYLDSFGKSKQLTRTAYGLDAAKQLERELQHELQNKKEPQAKRMTLQQLYDEYFEAKKYEVREFTVVKGKQTLKRYVLSTMSKVRLDKLNAKVLQEWKISIESRELALETKQKIYKEFRAMLNYAVRLEYIPKNPLLLVGNFKSSMVVTKDPDFYTPEEFRKFIAAAKEKALQKQEQKSSLGEWNYYVFFNIAYYTGLRKGEIFGLQWSDIQDGYLSVKRSVCQKLKGEDRITPPKNKSSIRTLQIPLPLIQILDEHKERQKLLPSFGADGIIVGDERTIRDTTLDKRNSLYAAQAGVKLIRIHDFRHSHASLLANSGINIQEIARRLGHSQIEMTWNTYSHLYPREEERAVTILNAV